MTVPDILPRWRYQLGILSHHSGRLSLPGQASAQALAHSTRSRPDQDRAAKELRAAPWWLAVWSCRSQGNQLQIVFSCLLCLKQTVSQQMFWGWALPSFSRFTYACEISITTKTPRNKHTERQSCIVKRAQRERFRELSLSPDFAAD